LLKDGEGRRTKSTGVRQRTQGNKERTKYQGIRKCKEEDGTEEGGGRGGRGMEQ